MPDLVCNDCVYLQALPGPNMGECHRRAPTFADRDGFAYWPMVVGDRDYCGDGVKAPLDDEQEESAPGPIEQCAQIVEGYLRSYPESVFNPPPAGQHGNTVDACSAAALRAVLPNIIRDIRALKYEAGQ